MHFPVVSEKFNICYRRARCALPPDSHNPSSQGRQAGTSSSLAGCVERRACAWLAVQFPAHGRLIYRLPNTVA